MRATYGTHRYSHHDSRSRSRTTKAGHHKSHKLNLNKRHSSDSILINLASTSNTPIMRLSPSFERLSFERKVNSALEDIEKILDIERHPRLAGDVEHTYESKYGLVDTVTNAALIAYMNVFEKMGLDSSVLQSIDKTQATTLRFDANLNCNLEKEVVVDIPINRSYEEEHKMSSTGIFGNSETKRVSKVCAAF